MSAASVVAAIEEATRAVRKASVMMAEMDTQLLNLEDLLIYFKGVDDAYNELDSARKSIYHLLDILDKNIVPQRLEDAGCEDGVRINFGNGVGYNFRRSTKYSVKTMDKAQLFAWLRERGDGAMIQETVNAQTLTTYLKGCMLDQGIEPPAGVAELTSYYGVGVNKYTPK
jgi:hypothetical protein